MSPEELNEKRMKTLNENYREKIRTIEAQMDILYSQINMKKKENGILEEQLEELKKNVDSRKSILDW